MGGPRAPGGTPSTWLASARAWEGPVGYGGKRVIRRGAGVARLLGHRNLRMTMRYAHVGDREIETAAERVGQAIAAKLGGPIGRTAAAS